MHATRKRLPKGKHRTELGTVQRMDGDFLYIPAHGGAPVRILKGLKDYTLIQSGISVKTIGSAEARNLFKAQWDIYQRVIT